MLPTAHGNSTYVPSLCLSTVHSSGGHGSFQLKVRAGICSVPPTDGERKELGERFLRGPCPLSSLQSRLLGELSVDGARHASLSSRSGRSARARVLSKALISARNSGHRRPQQPPHSPAPRRPQDSSVALSWRAQTWAPGANPSDGFPTGAVLRSKNHLSSRNFSLSPKDSIQKGNRESDSTGF